MDVNSAPDWFPKNTTWRDGIDFTNTTVECMQVSEICDCALAVVNLSAMVHHRESGALGTCLALSRVGPMAFAQTRSQRVQILQVHTCGHWLHTVMSLYRKQTLS